MTDQSKERAAAIVVKAIIETIEETKNNGAPLGVMYAALMGVVSYNSFMSVISALDMAKIIKVRNNCAYIGEASYKAMLDKQLRKLS